MHHTQDSHNRSWVKDKPPPTEKILTCDIDKDFNRNYTRKDLEDTNIVEYIEETQMRRQEREELSDDLKKIANILGQKGVLRFIPRGVYDGMPFVTPRDIKRSQLVKYSYEHIIDLARRDEIDNVRLVDHQPLITMSGVAQLIDRQRRSESGQLRSGGQRPGGSWSGAPDRDSSSG